MSDPANKTPESANPPKAGFARPRGSAYVCTKYGCRRKPLKYMHRGDTHQTALGFFTIHAAGWYCPHCGGGYGDWPNAPAHRAPTK